MPFDKILHFDQSLGELEDVDGGGRYSIFAPETIAGATFSPGGWTAAYGGRSGSLLRLDVAAGAPSPRSFLPRRFDAWPRALGFWLLRIDVLRHLLANARAVSHHGQRHVLGTQVLGGDP
jgi:hypothetical protein